MLCREGFLFLLSIGNTILDPRVERIWTTLTCTVQENVVYIANYTVVAYWKKFALHVEVLVVLIFCSRD